MYKKKTKEEKIKRGKAVALATLASVALWYNTNKESQYQNDKVLTNIEEIKEENPNENNKKQLNKIRQEIQALLETSRNENYNLIVEKVAQAFNIKNTDISVITDGKDKINVGISVTKDETTYEYRKKIKYDKTENEFKEEKKIIKELPEEIVELLDDYNWISDTISRFKEEKLTEKELNEIEKELKVIREYYVDCKNMIVKVSIDGSLNVTSFTNETKEEKREKIEDEKNEEQSYNSKNVKMSFKDGLKVSNLKNLNIEDLNKIANKRDMQKNDIQERC